jgi:glycosyltransferase involved in cell wall biosynthesis
MNITVIVCTYNRCQSLTKALESVAASIVPDSTAWEVLVVDNNSKDQTHGVVEDLCRRYPGRFRYVFEGSQGKSFALNTGIREAKGEILAFTDDDVIVAPNWLQNLTAPLVSGEYAGAAGRILAGNEFKCPSWLALEGEYNLGGVLALHNPNESAGETTRPSIGANMAFRKPIFEKYGDFRTDLGPTPGSEIRNEDTELSNRLMALGARLWYEPSAVVYHGIPENRLSKSYFLAYWYNYGRASVREHANRASVRGIPRWFFSVPLIVFNVLPARLRIWLFARDPKRRFFFKCTVWRTLGEIVELPQLWLESRRDAREEKGAGTKLQSSDVTLGK